MNEYVAHVRPILSTDLRTSDQWRAGGATAQASIRGHPIIQLCK